MKRYYIITVILAFLLYAFILFRPYQSSFRVHMQTLWNHSSKILADKFGDRWNTNSSDANTISLEESIRGPLLQDDPRIITYIKEKGFLKPPPSNATRYNLQKPNRDPSMGQSQIVKRIFQGKKHGFFVECGALDGETRSNTLSLERDFGWEGLLIEGDPKNFKLLEKKNRKVWTANCCLAVHPFPHQVVYKQSFNTGKIQSQFAKENVIGSKGTAVQCFPLFSLLSAIGVKTVDFFSLDVEGFEMGVLESIPFQSVRIQVLTVEFTHGKGGASALKAFMKGKGYRVVTMLTHRNRLANDVIFAHNSFPIDETLFPNVIQSEKMDLNSNVAFTQK